ncbi:hypothetical protein CLAUR_031010 [Clostridium felsineum]|nr:hypothetical protein CLAUR_031010 [Clostridium felsineum]
MFDRTLHARKARPLIVITLLGIVMLERTSHSSKALYPMLVIPFGSVIPARFQHL